MPTSEHPDIRGAITRHLADTAAARCLGFEGRWLSGAEVAERIVDLQPAFGTGRRLVVLTATPTLDFVLAYLAALDAGHVVLLGSPATAAALATAYDADNIDTVRRHDDPAHDLHPDLALLLSTSGSTGSAKLVRLSHSNLVANARSIAEYLELRPTDCGISTLPLHYCYGLSVLHSHLYAGGGFYVTPHSVVDDCFWRDMRDQGVTNIAGVPHTFELIERAGVDRLDLPDLRFVTQAGGRMEPDRVIRFAELADRYGWQLFVMYGQTEATARMAYLPPQRLRTHPGAVGVAIPGGELQIRSVDDDTPQPVGAEGRVVYRGPNVMMGYADTPPDLCRGAELDELVTGDLGYVDDEGLLHIVGRESRFAKVFGSRIDLHRVELVLRDAGWSALVASDDRVIAVSVETAALGRAADEVAAGVRSAVVETTGLPERLVTVAPVTELPRYPTGKPDYPSVLAAVAAISTTGAGTSTGVAGIFERILTVDEVAPTDSFVTLGGTSLDFVEASICLEQHLGTLPSGWHLMAVADLDARASSGRRSPIVRVETTIVLRAFAIAIIVSTHVHWLYLPAGGHLLLAVAGYNFARFHLARTDRPGWLANTAQTFAKIAAITSAWIAAQMILLGNHSIESLLLVNTYFGEPEHTGGRWQYWYIESLVHIAVVLVALLAWNAIRRIERQHRFWFALALLTPALALRFEWVNLGDPSRNSVFQADTVVWIFLLGWAIERSTSVAQKVAVGAITLAVIPGYFVDDHRSIRLLVGVLLLTWIPWIPLIRPLHRVLGWVASASLTIYLTHYMVFPRLDDHLARPAVFATTLAIGVAAWFAGGRLTTAWRRFVKEVGSRYGVGSPATTGRDDSARRPLRERVAPAGSAQRA